MFEHSSSSQESVDQNNAAKAAALAATAAGISVVPPTGKGTKKDPKAPLGDWKRFQEQPADRAQIERWYANGKAAIGVVTGMVSGNLEALDFDNREVYLQFLELMRAYGLDQLVALVELGYCEDSPNGVHWLYRCSDIGGNEKLARRLLPDGTTKTTIETRAEGGYLIVAPTIGLHDDGQGYVLRSGGFDSIASISPEDREIILALARALDELPVEDTKSTKPLEFPDDLPPPTGNGRKVRPGDDYNQRANWDDILVPAGWKKAYTSGSKTHWVRPGKGHGSSATTSAPPEGGPERFRVFSTNTNLRENWNLTKFEAYTQLHHHGDYKAAAKALRDLKYGTPNETTSTTDSNATEGKPEDREQGPPVFDGPPLTLSTELLPVIALVPEMLPPVLRPWLMDIAERGSFPIEYPVVAAFSGLGSLIGKRVVIRPKRYDDWLVCPVLWSAVVGPPGWLKTPSVEEALRPLKRLVAKALEQHEKANLAFFETAMVAKAKAEAAKSKLTTAAKKGANPEELRQLAAEVAACGENAEPPVIRRYMVNDATTEKLGDILSESDNGVMVFRDELTGLIKSLEKQGMENARSFYLESWNGLGSYHLERVTRPTKPIENHIMTIAGTIQPGPLARFLRSTTSSEGCDGFIQRFQMMVYPDQADEYVMVDRKPDAEARDAAFRIFEGIEALKPAEHGLRFEEHKKVYSIGFSTDAQELWIEWHNALENRLRMNDDNALIILHLSKYRSLMPALALLFEVIERVGNDERLAEVGVESVELAMCWCEVLESHARRIYQSAQEGDAETASGLAARIKAGSLPNPFTAKDVYHNGWSGLDTPDTARKALGYLEGRRWISMVEGKATPQGGRPTDRYWINPSLLKKPDPVSEV